MRNDPNKPKSGEHDATSYFALSQVDIALEDDRFTSSEVAGQRPTVDYPQLPANNPWGDVRLPDEEPLNESVDAIEPCGTPAEISRSLVQAIEAIAPEPRKGKRHDR
jgi:hypothetical protein